MFFQLKKRDLLEKNEPLFDAALFVHMSNIAENSSETFTNELYLDLMRIKKSVLILKNEGGKEAYAHYKARLAHLLELDMGSPLNQHLLKEALKMNIYTPSEIQKMKAHLLSLPSDKICAIIHGECEGEHHYEGSPEGRRFLK